MIRRGKADKWLPKATAAEALITGITAIKLEFNSGWPHQAGADVVLKYCSKCRKELSLLCTKVKGARQCSVCHAPERNIRGVRGHIRRGETCLWWFEHCKKAYLIPYYPSIEISFRAVGWLPYKNLTTNNFFCFTYRQRDIKQRKWKKEEMISMARKSCQLRWPCKKKEKQIAHSVSEPAKEPKRSD